MGEVRRLLAMAALAGVTMVVGGSTAAHSAFCPTMTEVGVVNPQFPFVAAINGLGQIVGSAGSSEHVDARHAFVWENGKKTDLGTLGGSESLYSAINDKGEVVGYSELEKGHNAFLHTHAFLWQDGKMTDLGTLGGKSSAAAAINNEGQIVGWSEKRGGTHHAFLWQHGKLADLGTLPGDRQSKAMAINNSGDVVGFSYTAENTNSVDAFVWRHGRMTNLGGNWDNAQVLAINDKGQIVGSKIGASGSDRAVLWQNGRITNLVGDVGQGSSYAVAINNRGQVVGTDYTGRKHAFLWEDGKTIELGSLPGGNGSGADAINERGQVVGTSYTEHDDEDTVHAFVWQEGRMTDLGTLRGDLASEATAINDNGEIAGYSRTSTFGTYHAVLWKLQTGRARCPVSKPWQSGDSVTVHENSIKVVGLIGQMSADAGRAIISVPYNGPNISPGEYCVDIFVWDRSKRKIVTVFDHRRCSPGDTLQSFGGIALAGGNAAWVRTSGGDILDSSLLVSSLATGRTSQTAAESAGGQGSFGRTVEDPLGEDDLLVYNDYERCLDGTDTPCPPTVVSGGIDSDQIRLAIPDHRIIATSAQEMTLLAVGGGRVVARNPAGAVIVLAPKRVSTGLVHYKDFSAESLIATYSYNPDETLEAATDGRTLAVLHGGALDIIPLPGNFLIHKRSLRIAAADLDDLDGSIAVYTSGHAINLLNLMTGRSIIYAKPSAGPVNAQLEPDGLYISAGNTLTFTPRAQVQLRLSR